MNSLWVVILCMLAAFQSLRASAAMIGPELEPKLTQSGSEDDIPVIISLAKRIEPSDFVSANRVTHPDLIRALMATAAGDQNRLKSFLRRTGAKNIRSFWHINSMAATVKVGTLREMATFPEVSGLRLDCTVHLPHTQYALEAEDQWNLDRISAPSLWQCGISGEGITVATMDNGVDPEHADLGPKWRGGTNSWYDPHNEHSTPYDADGHGTQVMGLILGGDASGSPIGAAPGAKWIAVKIFNDLGDANFADIHLGFQWLLDPDGDPDTDDAPDIVNNSWGLREHVDECILEFHEDIEVLRAAGMAVVFAAGNAGPGLNTSISPANYDNTFAAGAIDSSNVVALSSSRGPSPCHAGIFPTVVAPGINVRTSDLTFGGVIPDSYAYVSGSSFAAPHVSGALALLMGDFPTMSAAEVQDALAISAKDLGEPGPDSHYGYGLVDVVAAYDLLESRFSCADFNHDEATDVLDIEVLADEWLKTECEYCRSDLNGSRSVDFSDYAEFARRCTEYLSFIRQTRP